QEPLDRAVDLLPHDSVPKAFRALTTYLNGVYRGDAVRKALGQQQMEAATASNVVFNKAVALFIEPQVVSGASDDYQSRLLGWLDDDWQLSTRSRNVYPDVFTSRLVPHAAEGATLMFGDVAAKGGRLVVAARWYKISLALGATSSFPFEGVVQQRL